jgi:TM2 domain-containing membrane protein YozV
MGTLKKRTPILALLLSVITPGLEQIYNGQFRKGIFYLVGVFLANLLFSFLLVKFYGMISYLIIMLGIFLFLLIDAVRGVRPDIPAPATTTSAVILFLIFFEAIICDKISIPPS